MTKSRTPSRLVKTESKRIFKQTLTISVVAVLILITFVFIVLPGFIRLINSFLDQPVWQQESELPTQAPLLTAPPAATKEENLKLAGYGEPKSTLVVLLNNQQNKEVQISEDGDFEVSVKLGEGQNTIAVFAVNSSGVESMLSREYSVILDTLAPSLEIITPQEDQEISGRRNQEITVSGTTEVGAKIYLNDRLIFPNQDGEFSSSFFLNEGENNLRFRAEDQAGNVSEQEIKVNFQF